MRHWLAKFLACLLLCLSGAAPTHAATLGEAEAKAAFIYNFVQFTSWPAGLLSSATTINVCVRPEAAVGLALGSLSGKQVHGVPLLVSALREDTVASCHVIYVEASDGGWLRKLAAMSPPLPLLTVADLPDPGAAAPMITLTLVGRKIAFDVDASQARRAGLTISSRVLQLARSVK